MSIRHFVHLKYNNLEKAHSEVVIKDCIRVPILLTIEILVFARILALIG